MTMRQLALISLLAISAAAFSQTAPGYAQGTVAVTIYNNNIALVQDIRPTTLPSSRTTIEFPDVSAQVRAETVSIGGADFGAIEQIFDYDLVAPNALMQKVVGQVVTIVRINPATGAETHEQAKVLAANGGVVLQIGARIEVLRDDGRSSSTAYRQICARGLRFRLRFNLHGPACGQCRSAI